MKKKTVALLLEMNAETGDLTSKGSGSGGGSAITMRAMVLVKQGGSKLTASARPDRSGQYPIEGRKSMTPGPGSS
jgi:hypothetical protein